MSNLMQNRKKRFKELSLNSLTFKNCTLKVQKERDAFVILNRNAEEIGITLIIEKVAMYKSNQFNISRESSQIKDITKFTYIETVFKIRFKNHYQYIYPKYMDNITWSVFGDHVNGYRLRDMLTEIQELKRIILLQRGEIIGNSHYITRMENQIVNLFSDFFKGKQKQTKINNFFKRVTKFNL